MAAQKPADVADGVIAGVTEPLGDILGGEKAVSHRGPFGFAPGFQIAFTILVMSFGATTTCKSRSSKSTYRSERFPIAS